MKRLLLPLLAALALPNAVNANEKVLSEMSDIEAIQSRSRPCEFSTLSSSQSPDTLVKQSFYRSGICLQVMDPLVDLPSSSSGKSRSSQLDLNTADRSQKDSRVLSLCEDLQAHSSPRSSHSHNDVYGQNIDNQRRNTNIADGSIIDFNNLRSIILNVSD